MSTIYPSLPLDRRPKKSLGSSSIWGTALVELILLGLGVATGLALLLQSKDLPSKEDYEAAQAKLKDSPTDPGLNTTIGKYLAFVEGKYTDGMAFLLNSKDATLKKLAEHEMDPKYTETPPQKVGMGDEWVKAAQSNKKLSEIFYDRAAQWYSLAWPDLEPAWKQRAVLQGQKLSAARPPGRSAPKTPKSWYSEFGKTETDGTFARSGSHSARISPLQGIQTTYFVSEWVPIPPDTKAVDAYAYIRSDGNGTVDQVSVWFLNENGAQVGKVGKFIPADNPFWNRLEIKTAIPPAATRVRVGVAMPSKVGTIWMDDASIKFDGNDKEMVPNNSFEER